MHHLKVFMPEDEDTFWDKGVFATDTELQNAIFYYTGKNLCFRGREEHSLHSQFAEIEGGYRYVQ